MIFVLVVSAAMAALTWLLGWWGVLLAAAIVGYVFHDYDGGGWRVALSAALAWGALLAVDALVGPFDVVAGTLGGVLRVPGVALVLITLAFPALLAWSAATVTATARRIAVSGRSWSRRQLNRLRRSPRAGSRPTGEPSRWRRLHSRRVR
jgi:hypothetical protein